MRGWARDLANDAYAAGRTAQKGGVERNSNPHGDCPDIAARWFTGYDASTFEGARTMQTPTERFMDALCEVLPAMTDEQRVRTEDAFNDAVDARVEQAMAYARPTED